MSRIRPNKSFITESVNRRINRTFFLTGLLVPGMMLFPATDIRADITDNQWDSMAGYSAHTYTLGSTDQEREWGYEMSPAIVKQAGWYDNWELTPYDKTIASFALDKNLVTQAEYAEFIKATGHRIPHISKEDYQAQGFLVHSYEKVEQFMWEGDRPQQHLKNHPVVLVSQADAIAYCRWQGKRLATEHEWEAACRGKDRRFFPWGNEWKNNGGQYHSRFSAPVSSFPEGKNPEGVNDLLGNVFEWTGSSFSLNRITLKSCSWDDAFGTCRCAFRHGRPALSRHILTGFRCARSLSKSSMNN